MFLDFIPITEKNWKIFDVFEQDYEAEFSAITKKEPDAEGRFAREADWKPPNSGLYLFVSNKPAGFAIRGSMKERSDMAEFFILPCYRKKGYGKQFAFKMFDSFPGLWQVRQIPAAVDAIAFWRSVVQEYTQGDYIEDYTVDLHWGKVLRQCFSSR